MPTRALDPYIHRMYSARMAEPTDCFSSTPPPAHGERPAGALEEDYNRVFDGLRIAAEVGHTVFARAVKFHVAKKLHELGVRTHMEMPAEFGSRLPCWVQQLSVAMRVPVIPKGEEWENFKEGSKPLLQSLSLSLVSRMVETTHIGARPSNRIHLIGPVRTDIKEIREGLFSFFVKQKWAVSHHE